jgi:hypothetical protein
MRSDFFDHSNIKPAWIKGYNRFRAYNQWDRALTGLITGIGVIGSVLIGWASYTIHEQFKKDPAYNSSLIIGLVAATLIAGAVSVIACCPMLIYMLHPAIKKCFTGGSKNFHNLRDTRISDEQYQVKKEQIESERKLAFEVLHNLQFPIHKANEVPNFMLLPEVVKRNITKYAFPEQFQHVKTVYYKFSERGGRINETSQTEKGNTENFYQQRLKEESEQKDLLHNVIIEIV